MNYSKACSIEIGELFCAKYARTNPIFRLSKRNLVSPRAVHQMDKHQGINPLCNLKLKEQSANSQNLAHL